MATAPTFRNFQKLTSRPSLRKASSHRIVASDPVTDRFSPSGLRGGLTSDQYILSFVDHKLLCIVRTEPATGRIEEFSLYPFTE